MALFYVVDYTDSIDQYRIGQTRVKKRHKIKLGEDEEVRVVHTDSLDLNHFLADLECFPGYRLRIANALVDFCPERQKLAVKLHPPSREPIDYEWGERANRILWERIELDEMMSWLSTLGGAFSALGDYKLACADVAGKISLQQMRFALRLGEPSLIARCRLYMAISLIQKYQFGAAKRIVQQIYRAEKRQYEPDTRLLKMCLGIWSKLRYEYELYQKRLNRPKQ
uniref:Uncharacterized protein F58A4.6 n=1 Tax=Culex pipiens TaxID=7175 RepID=A0A8D8JUY0_CULPI